MIGGDGMAIKPNLKTMPSQPETEELKIIETKQTSGEGCCLMCGEHYAVVDRNFYKVSSPLWKYNNGYAPICKKCLNAEYDRFKKKYGERNAVIACFAMIDLPFANAVFDGFDYNFDQLKLGDCIRVTALRQYKNKRFINSIIDGEIVNNSKDSEDDRWSNKDKQNKNRVLKIIKYDPFEDFSDKYRKNMFALCSDYLNDESIIEDPHKLRTVIEIVKLYGQVEMSDERMNFFLRGDVGSDTKSKQYGSIKKDLLDTVNKLSKENGIAVRNSIKGSKGSSSLAYHVKQLTDENFTAAENNLFDVETSEAMQQIANLSMNSIMKTIRLSETDYVEMIEEQRKINVESQKKIAELEETNRKLQIELQEKKYKKVVI